MRGSGKSTWIRDYIIADAARFFVWDPRREYTANVETVLAPADLWDWLETVDDGEQPISVAVQPVSAAPRELADEFGMFADTLAAFQPPGVVIIEELVLLHRYPDAVDAFVTQSRHWSAPVVLASQRAAMIPKTSRVQADHVVSFCQRDPTDIEALVDVCGVDASIVASYTRYEWFQWSLESDLDNKVKAGPVEK